MSNSIETKVELKQVGKLSPLKFNLYVNDVFENIIGSIRLFEQTINILIYADHVVFFVDDVRVLQLMINRLSCYCEKLNLVVNLNKFKILIFNRHGRRSQEEN